MIRVPTGGDDEHIFLDIQALIGRVYKNGRFVINYNLPTNPPLAPDDEAWVRQLLEKRGKN